MHTSRQARAEIVMGDDGRSRGYGTVRFDSNADAATAIEVKALDAAVSSILCVPLMLDWRCVDSLSGCWRTDKHSLYSAPCRRSVATSTRGGCSRRSWTNLHEPHRRDAICKQRLRAG